MESIKIELPRINNIFSYVMVVSTLVFLYSLSFGIRNPSKDSIDEIIVLSFLYSAVGAIFWQVNGYLRDICGINYLFHEKVNKRGHQNRLKKFAKYQMGLLGAFIIVLTVILYFGRV